MSVVVEIEDPITEKLKGITGEASDRDAVRVALERFVRDYEVKPEANRSSDLPEEDWDELFSMPMIPSSIIDEALRKERE